jgi:hypothetical protein
MGLHTLCLLDIRVKEPDMAAMCAGKVGVYEPPRYMSNNTCIEQVRTNALSDVFDSGLTRADREWPLNEAQRPHCRVARVALGTGSTRVRGIGRAWRNGGVSSSPALNPDSQQQTNH